MWRFWTWYDRLKEPWRELLLLLFLAIGFGGISLGFVMEKHNLYLIFGGFFFILLLFLSRACFSNQEAESRKFRIRGRRL